MRALFVFIATLALVGCIRAVDMGFPLVSVFSSEEMRMDGAKWTTAQAPDGTLFFGGDALVSYDGARWQLTPAEGAYALRGLDFGPDGRLWAAATGELGWFERRAAEGWRFASLRAKLPGDADQAEEFWNVFALGEGAVFVSTSRVLHWDGAQFHVWDLPGENRLPAMRWAGRVYVYHRPTGLYEVTPGGLRRALGAEVFRGAMVAALEREGDRWRFVTTRGLLTCDDGAHGVAGGDAAAAEFIRRGTLTAAVRLSNGDWAVGTFSEGLALLRADGTLRRVVAEREGLPSRRVYSLFIDKDDGLWVTTSTHVCRVSVPSASAVFDDRNGLPAPLILKIVPDREAVAVATESGVYRLDASTGQFRSLEGMPSARIWDLRANKAGLLLTTSRGVFQWAESGGAEIYRTSAANAFVIHGSRLWPGSHLVSVGRDVVRVDAAGSVQTVVRALPDIASSLAEDAGGRLWIGTATRGVQVADLSSHAPVPARAAGLADGLPENLKETVVIGSAEGGVAVLAAAGGWWRAGGRPKFEAVENYPARMIAATPALDRHGSFWVVHPATPERPPGVARIAIDGPRARYEPYAVEGLGAIGIPRTLCVEATVAGNVLWIGGSAALLRHDPGLARPAGRPAKPLVRFTAHDIAGRELAAGARLPASVHTMRFDLALPEFGSPQSYRLETRLVGVDRDWIPTTSAAGREITMLRHGSFNFQSRAVAETGETGEVAEIRFHVDPPWWQRPEVVAAGVLLALGAGYGAYRWRVRALRERNAELETRVRERTEQLARANAAKTEFVASMSHDIRNPLNGIVGLTLSLEQTLVRPEQRQKVEMLRECAAYLSSLVEDVLDFASIEAGKVEIKAVPYAPRQILASVATILQAQAPESGASFEVEVDPALPEWLEGDPDRIRQIVMNYATNALKYAGGVIRLSARPVGREVEFSVADGGPGLDEAQIAQLFTKFTRLKSSVQAAIAGTGLGLASCRLLAERMGGSVGVVSSPGQGARFYVRFGAQEAVARQAVVAYDGSRPLRVLIVEDTDYNAEATRAVLAQLGHESERARTGAEAVERFASAPFDVILMDRNLPDMDGLEVTRRIRGSSDAGHDVAILAVTAYCTEADRHACEVAGMDAFVGKPLTPEKLRLGLQAATRRFLPSSPLSDADMAAAGPGLDYSLLAYVAGGGLGAGIDRLLGEIESTNAELSQGHATITAALSEIATAAHRMASHAQMVGASRVAAAAAQLEDAARAGDKDAIDACWHDFVSGLEELKTELKARMSQVQA